MLRELLVLHLPFVRQISFLLPVKPALFSSRHIAAIYVSSVTLSLRCPPEALGTSRPSGKIDDAKSLVKMKKHFLKRLFYWPYDLDVGSFIFLSGKKITWFGFYCTFLLKIICLSYQALEAFINLPDTYWVYANQFITSFWFSDSFALTFPK